MAYEVQESCLCGGWTNTWSYEDDDGITKPSTFDTIEEAEIALDYFFEDCQTAVDDNYLADMPDREDFRIVEITNEIC
jgi:hypothetical protein